MTINLVFDIDGVLAGGRSGEIENARYFKKNGMITTAIVTHYIFPGVIELMRALFVKENVRVSFFSSGDKNRNHIFVKELLRLASIDEQKIEETLVLSREDLIKTPDGKKQYEISHGNCQKDLKTVLREGDSLENAVLIEDDDSYTAPGQERNVLLLRGLNASDFSRLNKMTARYDLEGNRPLGCLMVDHERQWAGHYSGKIFLRSMDGEFQVRFRDKNTFRIRRERIKTDHPLCEKLKEVDHMHIEDIDLANEIRAYVDTLGGATTKISRRFNQIYYLAGLLFSALEQPEPITTVLFEHQIREGKAVFHEARRNESLYRLGLERLRQYNPNLQLVTPHYYVTCINLPLSDEEKAVLQAAINNENRGCCIQ